VADARKYLGGGLGRHLVALTHHPVLGIHVNQGGFQLGQFHFVENTEGGDDENVSGSSLAGGGAVHGNDARSPFRLDGVGGEAFAVIHVPDVDLLVFADIRGVQQILVDGTGAFVVKFRVGRGHPVDFGLEHGSLHG